MVRRGAGPVQCGYGYPRKAGHRPHRPLRLRQIHLSQDPGPDERSGTRHQNHRQCPVPGHRDLRQQGGRDLAAQADRHGLPEAQPLPHEHLRQHCLRPQDPRRAQQEQAGRRCGEVSPGGGHLGRGEGPAQEVRPLPLRRTAAAGVHRPGPGGGAGYSADGRGYLGSGPHLHQQD